jgi:hypothetical protein
LRHSDCQECQALWRWYASATTDHICLENKLRLAALKHDLERVAILTPEVEMAVKLRDAGREAVRLHEAEPHAVP